MVLLSFPVPEDVEDVPAEVALEVVDKDGSPYINLEVRIGMVLMGTSRERFFFEFGGWKRRFVDHGDNIREEDSNAERAAAYVRESLKTYVVADYDLILAALSTHEMMKVEAVAITMET